MKRIYNFILLVCLVQLAVAQNRIAEIRENLLGNYSDRVLVVSHRADWRNAPENSLQGIRNCIDMGVDMVEIDLKKTKDGHLVVMHDKTINRTMTGKGNAEDYTLAELKAMRLKNGAGCKTRHQIPTLEEVMLLCKGKIMVNIDKGYDYFQEAYAVLEKTGTIDHCVIKAGLPYERVKAENGDVLDKVIFMPGRIHPRSRRTRYHFPRTGAPWRVLGFRRVRPRDRLSLPRRGSRPPRVQPDANRAGHDRAWHRERGFSAVRFADGNGRGKLLDRR